MKKSKESKSKELKTKEMKTKELIIKISVFIAVLSAFVGIIYYANYDKPGYYNDADKGTEYETARVIEILEDNAVADDTMEGILRGSRVMKIELLTGRYKGDTVIITNYFSTLYNVDVSENDKLSVRIDTESENNYTVSVYNYYRQNFIVVMVIVFFAALVLIGGKKGFMSVAGLIIAFVSIVYILIPLLLKGFSVLPLTVAIIGIITFLTFYLLGGIQIKTISAFTGTMAGVCIAAFLAIISSKIAQLTGFQMEEAESLTLIKSETQIQIKNLFTSGVMISSVGAIMDVAMTISSAVHELRELNPDISRKQLFLSGMNVGRDAMGTMSNTLILAFAGTSLNMMILIYSYGVSYIQLMNTDFVVIEVIRGIAGSMGIVFTVPAVAYISAFIDRNKKGRN